uniref:Uncharacterized protein LOC100186104 n=1 Tax=Phallusia mammillata TaxID=59560 RepID=A0A6F9DHT6_9ASCI|nr:uncharacterized protein LOC100186104 [Phallusia mammillata]
MFPGKNCHQTTNWYKIRNLLPANSHFQDLKIAKISSPVPEDLTMVKGDTFTGMLMISLVLNMEVRRSNGCHYILAFGHDQISSPSAMLHPQYYQIWGILQSHDVPGKLIDCTAKKVLATKRQFDLEGSLQVKRTNRFETASETDEIKYIVETYPRLCKALLQQPLTAGRYKLLLPCHVIRPEDRVETSSGDRSGPATPQQAKTSGPVQPGGARLTLPPITNENVAHEIDIIKQYLKDTGITANMADMTKQLLQLNVLPYNPYPGFVRRFRRLAERFHLRKEPLHAIRKSIDCVATKLGETVLSSVKTKNGSSFWGLEHIVSHVNPKILEACFEPIQSSTVSNEHVSQETNQQISLLVSLSGPCVFKGSICNNWTQVELKVGVVVTSQDFSVAGKYFSLTLVEDFKHIESSNKHCLLDLIVPVEDEHGWTSRAFGRSDIESIVSDTSPVEDEIKRLIVHAVMSKKRITLNFLLCQTSKSSASKTYIPATKTYYLLFLQTPVNSQGNFQASQPRLVVSTLPFQALHEGVFLDRGQAEQYLATFQKYYSPGGQPQPTAGKKRSKIDPMHTEMMGPIIQAWQMKIASLILEHSMFSVVHYLFLLTLAQTRAKSFAKQTEEGLVVQICRLYRGTGAKLKCASFLHPVITQLLTSVDENILILADRMIAKYKDLLLEVADPELCARSSETQSLKHLIECVMPTPENEAHFHSTVLNSKLEELNYVVTCVVLGFSEDAIELSPAIKAAKSQLDSTFPHLVPKFPPMDNPGNVQYGIKNTAWPQVDKMKINKQVSVATSQAPKAVASHLAMMQYCADIRMDEVWRALYESLLLVQDYLPPNPYPILVSHLRKANMSVQSFFEADATSVKRMVQRKIVALEGSKELMTVTGSNAFALKASLTLLGPLGYRQSFEIASKVVLTPPGEAVSGQPIQVGPMQVASCGGLLPPTIHFGTVSPYLKSVDVDEHCFVRGPSDKTHHAANVLANIVLTHLRDLRSKGILPHQARFGGIVMKLNNLTSSAATRFESEFSAAIDGNHPIHVELYYPLDWRYILIKKRILAYYVTETNERVATLFRLPEGIEDFRSSIVFLHPADARYCVKQIPIAALPQDVATVRYWRSRDWPALVTHLVTRAQHLLAEGVATKRRTVIGSQAGQSDTNSLLAFCWRYHSGIPGQIDYLRCLNSAIESVMSFGVEATEEGAQISSAMDQALVEKMIVQFKWKMNEIISQGSSLAGASFAFLLRSKMDIVAFKDPNSNALFVKFDRESLQILREVNGYLLAIRNATAQDLMLASSTVLQYVKKQMQAVL